MRRLPPLLKKLGRDLSRQRAQALSVLVLLTLGVGLLVSSLGTRDSLGKARDDYYREQRMADLQFGLVRAPNALLRQVRALPGVQAAEARVGAFGLLALPGVDEPLSARLLSLDAPERLSVNRPWRVHGRWPEQAAGVPEAAVNEAFAEARGLRLGAELEITVRGSRERLRVVGIVNSPEFVFISPPGELLPQPERFAVIWMPRRALEQAAGLQGAFNELLLRLAPGAHPQQVGRAVESLLSGYGVRPGADRTRIPSARFLDQELDQLATMASVLPPAFLAVAVFLLNITLTRLVEAERSTIGLMKAFGLKPLEIALGYLGFGAVIAALGVLFGLLLGAWLGHQLCELYLQYYRLPVLDYRAGFAISGGAAAVGIGAALLGSGVAVRRVLKLHPAEALAPPPPPAFKRGAGPLEWLARGFDPLTRVVLRRVLGFPRRSLTTVLGVSAALVLMVLSGQAPAAIEQLLELSFGEAKRQHVSLSLVERAGPEALKAIGQLPGVQRAEPYLAAEAVFSHAGRRVDEAVIGLMEQPRFERLIDVEGRALPMRGDGLILTASLARQLGARPGDRIHVQLTSGRQHSFTASVVAAPEVTIGSSAYMEIGALARRMGEPARISGVHLRLDPMQRAAFDRAVRATPAVVGVNDVEAAYASMDRLFDESTGVMTTLFTVFAVLMAGGIAYATSSVILAEQRRDLATLQVLGYGRREASYVLLAEIALLALCALPIGLIGGHYFARAFLRAMATDVFTFPSAFEPALYVRAAAVVLLALLAAALLVRRGVDRIALVDSLKSRE